MRPTRTIMPKLINRDAKNTRKKRNTVIFGNQDTLDSNDVLVISAACMKKTRVCLHGRQQKPVT